MTGEGNMAMARPIIGKHQKMEVAPPGGHLGDLPQLHFSADHQLSPDLSMYASSPNSLFMYEQERTDMQNSFSPRCATGSVYRSSMSESSDTLQLDSMDMEYVVMPDFLQSSFTSNDTCPPTDGTSQSDPMWEGNDFSSPVNVKMEDVFQSDTIANEGPTLAALNCECDESILEDIESVIRDDLATSDMSALEPSLPPVQADDARPTIVRPGCSKPQTFLNVPQQPVRLPTSTATATFTPTATISCDQGTNMVDCKSSLHRLLQQKTVNDTSNQSTLNSMTSATGLTPTQQVSLPAVKVKPELKVDDRKWAEVERFLHEDEALAAKIKTEPVGLGAVPSPSTSSGRQRHDSSMSTSTVSTVNIKEEMDSHDEGFGSDHCESDGDNDDHDWMSDLDTDDSDHPYRPQARSPDKHKEPQYFWQYNAQSKGPKQSRLCIPVSSSDPHVLHNFEDPVFDPGHKDTAIRHGGKARRGDGNDIAPNPKKLYQIGHELKKLSQVISDLSPAGNVPVSVRNRSKREKNKLASRACRLKKKAQHEANKVKLFGLEQEHGQLMNVLQGIKQELAKRIKSQDNSDSEKMTEKLDQLYKENLSSMIAGHTADYVNMVVEAVKSGDLTGGLDF